MDDLLCQPNVAMSSVVSASATLLGTPTPARLVGKNSLIDSTIRFIYEYLHSSGGQIQLDFGEKCHVSNSLKI